MRRAVKAACTTPMDAAGAGAASRISRGLLVALGVLLMGAANPALVKSRQAEKKFHKGDLDGALRLYEEARTAKPGTSALDYDVGVVKFKKGDASEAAHEFSTALAGGDEALRSRSYYNLGNCLYQGKDYDGAVQAYRRALEMAPGDGDAKHNLEMALRMKQEQQQKQQQKQNQQKQDQNQKNQDQKQDQKNQDKQNQQQKQDQQKQADQQKQDQNQKPEDQAQKNDRNGANPPAALDKNAMSPEDAKRLLDAIREEEARLLEAKEEKNAQEAGVARDW